MGTFGASSSSGGEGPIKPPGKKSTSKTPPKTPTKPETSAKTPAKTSAKAPPTPAKTPKTPKKGGRAKDAEEPEQEPEGEGDSIASDEDDENEGEDFEGSEEDYGSDLGLLDFVIADSDVEEEEEEEEVVENNIDRPDSGIEMEPDEDPKNGGFNIVRLIQYTNKGGADDVCPINMGAEYFTVQYGDFLLDLSNFTIIDWVHVRNYYGEERFIPRRMLQSIRLPWGLPTNIKLDDNGVGLPVAFVGEVIPAAFGGIDFDEDEVVMVKVPGDPTTVIDFERRVGEIKMREPKIKPISKKGKEIEEESEEEAELLTSPCDYPWGLRVNLAWINRWIIGKTPGKKAKGDKKGKEKDSSGEGPSKGPSKRKRDVDEEEPKPKPKKRATLTTVSRPDDESIYEVFTTVSRTTNGGSKQALRSRTVQIQNNIAIDGSLVSVRIRFFQELQASKASGRTRSSLRR
jgi:hypothetical protein